MTRNTPLWRTVSLPAVAAAAAIGLMTGCDVDDESSPAELEEAVLSAQTVGDLLTVLPPEAIPAELLDQDLETPLRIVSADEVGLDERAVGDLAQASDPDLIGEDACATSPITPGDGAVVTAAVGTATSPDASYNAAGCPGQFITEVTGVVGQSFSTDFGWLDINTEEKCDNARGWVSTYGGTALYVPFPTPRILMQWENLGTTEVRGVWTAPHPLLPTGACFPDPQGPLPAFDDTELSKVRTAARATTRVGAFRPYTIRVAAGID